MTGFTHAASQIGAVWNMARNRAGWREELDRSVDGVFRSFSAMVYAAPLFALNFAAGRLAAQRAPELAQEPIVAAPMQVFLPVQMFAAYADWCATLVVLALLARATGASRRAAELIAGYNWLQVPLAGAQSAASAAVLLPGSRDIGTLLVLPVIAVVVALLWGYLRRALQLKPAWTLIVLVLLTLIGLVVQSLAASLGYGLYRLFS